MTPPNSGPVYELPRPAAALAVELEDGSHILARRHGNARGPRLFLSHGNGFASDGYYPFWRLLLRDFDLVLFDFRNHGQNAPSDPARHLYVQMARDLDRVITGVEAEFGRKAKAGLFHSMSGRAAMKHAIEIGWRWDALVLFDPPNMPPPGHPAYGPMAKFERRLADWARRRRCRFADPAELTQEYLAARAASSWTPGTHALMARSVLRRSDDGEGWALVCAPELEASIYEQATSLNLWPEARAYGGPVKLIGADPTLAYAPTGLANRALAAENGYDYVAIPGAGHLLQIERPAACLDAVRAFLAAQRIQA